jgi:hypothetical protein
MKQILLAALLATSITANAKLCKAITCDVNDENCRTAFVFVGNPTKTLSGTVSKISECTPLLKLMEVPDSSRDACVYVTLTYFNSETNANETVYYKNGATSVDGTTWDREQNPSCPTLP